MTQEQDKETKQPGVVAPERIHAARAGDKTAMAEIYEATSQEIYRTIHSMVRDEELTLDIQQDTYVSALSHLDQLRDEASLMPWLRQIAVNEVRRQLRKKTPLLFTDMMAEDEDEQIDFPDESPKASPELNLDRNETRRLVGEILDKLTDAQRMLVGMYYYEQIPIRQIAETLSLSEGTVKNQLFRSRKRMEKEIRKMEKQGVSLFGLAPIPFLTALLKNMEPTAEGSSVVLKTVLAKTAEAGTQTAIHVGRRFFETAAGKILLGLMSAAVIGGGILSYNYWREHSEKELPDEIHMVHTTESSEETDPRTVPDQPDVPVVTPDPSTDPTDPTDPTANPTEATAEPTEAPTVAPTEPQPTEPKPTEPKPTDPKPTGTQPAAPAPTDPKPTTPQPTEPKPTDPAPTEPTDPEPTDPEPTDPEPTDPDPSRYYRGTVNTAVTVGNVQTMQVYVLGDGRVKIYSDDPSTIRLVSADEAESVVDVEPGEAYGYDKAHVYTYYVYAEQAGTTNLYCECDNWKRNGRETHLIAAVTVTEP